MQWLLCSGDGCRDHVAEAVTHHDPTFICQLERVREQTWCWIKPSWCGDCLQYPAWDICWSPKSRDWPQQFRAHRSLLLSDAHAPSRVCWDLQTIWQLFSHSFHICASHWYSSWTETQYGQLISSENTPIAHVKKQTPNYPTSNKEADT